MKRSMLTKLIVGLGNLPMITTRHSIGMAVLNKLVEDLNLPWHYESRCTGFIARLSTENHDTVFLKPKIPMNINGRSILKTVTKYDVSPSNIYLLHDDLDKPLGKIRIKLEGSAGGHNGVKSAIASLKTDKIKRFKIGIDRPSSRNDVVKYVLQDFRRKELPLVEAAIEECVELIKDELDIALSFEGLNSSDILECSDDEKHSPTEHSIINGNIDR